MQLALLDACVLYPMYLRDVMLQAAEAELFGPLWSAQILAELHRNLIANGAMPAVGADRLVHAVRRSFVDSEVTGHEHLTDAMPNHPKDRHVLAAAVHARADLLVTANLRDFPGILQQMVKDYWRPPRDLGGPLAALVPTVPGFAGVVRELTS